MVDNNVSAYLCGHAHLYIRARITGPPPNRQQERRGTHARGFDPAAATRHSR
jgi:hypothetical protein